VITRATVSLADFFVKTSRFVHRGGTLIAIKGEHIDHEITEIETIFDNRYFALKKSVPKTVCSVRHGTIIFISHL
jgi:16S rRNA G527 N7-methylase RsmG